jgi:NAD(P)H-dependent FMN reductase
MALALVAGELFNQGVDVSVVDAREMNLNFPGYPATDDAKAMQSAIKEADGVVFATPEYHGGFSAMTKLILENMGFPSALQGKPVALLGVAAGGIGAWTASV